MCQFPININNYKIPCGKCGYCIKTRASDWTVRLLQEVKVSSSAHVVLLTYNEKTVPWGESPKTGDLTMMLNKGDLQKFLKRLRKKHEIRKETKKIKYYAVGEYGGNGNRPHYHIIIFNSYDEDIFNAWELKGDSLGWVSIKPLKLNGLGYLTTYHTVVNDYAKKLRIPKQFATMSQGLGQNYLTEKVIEWHKSGLKNWMPDGSRKAHLPRYYSSQIFNQSELKRIQEKSIEFREKNVDKISYKVHQIVSDDIIKQIKKSKT